jgi:hypothetical protein
MIAAGSFQSGPKDLEGKELDSDERSVIRASKGCSVFYFPVTEGCRQVFDNAYRLVQVGKKKLGRARKGVRI